MGSITEDILLQPDQHLDCDVLIIDVTDREISDDFPDINRSFDVPIRLYLNGKLLIVHSERGIEQFLATQGTGDHYVKQMNNDQKTITSCNELLRTGFPIVPMPRPILPIRPGNRDETEIQTPTDDAGKSQFSWITRILQRKLDDAVLRSSEERIQLMTGYIDRFSHDIGTPITSLRTGIEELIHADVESLSMDQENKLRSLQEQVTRIDDLRTETLNLNKFDSGTISLYKKLTSIHPLIQDVYLRNLPLADKKDQTVYLDCPHISAMIDGDKIRSVLENLIGNAVKYTQNHGIIKINVEKKIDIIRISVSDDGPGVPEGAEKEIFKRFTRMHKHIAGGTGLGLSIVRTIVEMHGGSVRYEHRSDGGSRFIVELPLKG